MLIAKLHKYYFSMIWNDFFYRFKCIDLDSDGIITPKEMLYFYEEQLHRMECMAHEPVLFEDIVCQMMDMVGPEVWFSFSTIL